MSAGDGLQDDIKKALSPWRRDFKAKLYGELICLLRVFRFREANNHTHKIISITFTTVWAISFLSWLYGVANVPPVVLVSFTAIVFAIIGRIWNIEAHSYAPFLDPPDNEG